MHPVIAKLIFFNITYQSLSISYFSHFKIKYETIITTKTIIAQIDKFVKNCFNFELDLRNAGRTNIKTAIKDIVGTIS